MTDLSVSQSYLMCVLNKKGKLPALQTRLSVCLIAAGLIDLSLSGSIEIDQKRNVTIKNELEEKYEHLRSLYNFIKESEPIKLNNIGSKYSFSFTGKKEKELFDDLGDSLVELGSVTTNTETNARSRSFIPSETAIDGIIQNIRAELLEDGNVSDDIIALVSLLDKSKQINNYFSKYEKRDLNVRLKEAMNTSSGQIVKELVDYVDTMLVVIAAAGTVS